MKELKTILCVMLLCLAQATFAQSNSFEYGAYLGTNRTFHNQSDDFEKRYNPKFGFSLGLLTQYHFSDRFSLRANLAFDANQSRLKLNSNGAFVIVNGQEVPIVGFVSDTRQDFLSLSILPQYSFGKNNNFYVNAGPYLSYLINRETTSVSDDGEKLSSSGTEFYDKWSWGFTAGVGTKFRLSDKLKMFVELSNDLGYKDKKFSSDPNAGFKMYRTSLQVGLNFKF